MEGLAVFVRVEKVTTTLKEKGILKENNKEECRTGQLRTVSVELS